MCEENRENGFWTMDRYTIIAFVVMMTGMMATTWIDPIIKAQAESSLANPILFLAYTTARGGLAAIIAYGIAYVIRSHRN